MANVQCPCGRRYQVPDAQLGYRVKCAVCNRTFIAEATDQPLEAAPSPPSPPSPVHQRKRIGDLAVERAFVSREHLDMCVEYQAALRSTTGQQGKPLGEVLVEKGLLMPHQIEALLKEQRGEDAVRRPADAARPPAAPQLPIANCRLPIPHLALGTWHLALFLFAGLAVLVAVLAVWFWPAPAAERALAAYLKSSLETSVQADLTLAVADLGLTVREFRVESLLPTIRYDYTPEIKVFASRNERGTWADFLEAVEMPAEKRQALALFAPVLPGVLTPQKIGSLVLTAQPATCYLLFRPRGEQFFKKGTYRFLLLRAETPKWSSGWKVAAYGLLASAATR